MKEAPPLKTETFLRLAMAQDPVALLESSSRSAIDVKLFLRARARAPFIPSDLLSIQGTNRATIYRRVRSWNSAGILSDPVLMPKQLSWNRQLKLEQEQLLRRAVDGTRRGRPPRMFQIVDPIRPRLPTPAESHALATLFGRPLVREFHARMAEHAAELIATPRGRKVFKEWLVPAAPPEVRGPLLEVSRAMAAAKPSVAERFIDGTRPHMHETTAYVMPRLAAMFQAAAGRGPRPK